MNNKKVYKILAVNGSHNDNGNTAYLLNTILDECLAYGFDTELVSAHKAALSAKIPFCVSCSSPCARVCYEGTYMEEVLNKISSADAVVFGSPVYFGSMSAQLKCLFDKTRDIRANKKLVGKIGGVVACGASKYGGQEATVAAIHNCMLVDGMTIIGPSSDELGCGHMGVCAQKPAAEDEFAISRAKMMASRIKEELLTRK